MTLVLLTLWTAKGTPRPLCEIKFCIILYRTILKLWGEYRFVSLPKLSQRLVSDG
jgi:hypothetical protein